MTRSNKGAPEGHNSRSVPGSGASSDQASSDEISLPELIRIFRRRKRIVVASVLVVFLLAALYCKVKTPRYEAVADLAINPEGSNALDMGDITASLGGGGLGFDEKLETQVHILKSKSLAWTVISELRLDRRPGFEVHRKYPVFGEDTCANKPALIEQTSPECRNAILKAFDSALTVQSIARTQAVEISFRNADPALAQDIVNHLAASYTQRTFMTRYDDTMKTSDWLSGQLAQIKSEVEKSESKLSQFQKQTGIFGTDENDNLVLSKLDDLSKELTDAEADRITKEAQYRVAQSGNPELIGTIVPDSVLPVLRGQEADLKNQLAQASSEYGPHYPAVIQLKDQLDQVEKSLQKEIANIQERFRSDYEVSATTEKQLKAAFDQQKQLAYDMSEGLDQYGILKRDVEAGNDLYEDLLKKLKEAGVVASLKAVTVDPIDLAVLPTKPIEPNTPLVLALSTILGLGVGIGLAFAGESLDNVIRSSDEFESLTTIPLFGVIPHVNIERKNRLGQEGVEEGVAPQYDEIVSLQRPNSQPAEAFRVLRTALQLATAGTSPKMIIIGSAVPGEGKTIVSMNLAAVFSQRAERVLLVDSDLRRGTIQRRTGIKKNFGLSGSLTGAGNWRGAVLELPQAPNLSILQAGHRPPNPAELLGSAQMHGFLEEWKAAYDRVIIDSPPALLVTDAVLIAQWTDLILLVSRVGVTPRAGFRRAAELLQSGKGAMTGMVVNDISAADNYYGYGYGYGYGAGYYSDSED